MFLLILPILAHALMTAHLLFNGFGIWSFAPLLALIPLFIRRPAMIWMVWLQSALLVLWGIEWLRADYALVMRRMAWGEPWLTAALILGGVAFFSFLSAFVFRAPRLQRFYKK